MKKENKKTLKVLCKIIEVFSMIGKVMSIIAIPFLILCMVFVPILIKNVDIKDNKISISGFGENIVITEQGKNNANIEVKVGNSVVAKEDEKELISTVTKMFNNDSKTKIITYVEVSLVAVIINIILEIIILSYIIKLFRSFGNDETPFKEENTLYIRKVANFMIAIIIVNVIGSIMCNILTGHDIKTSFDTASIFEILIIFVLSYIFEYGCELQKSSKKKLYE